MNILFISNFYPPVSRGGYEMWCQEVADSLRDRGHEIFVLSSRYGAELIEPEPKWIHRLLHLEMNFVDLRNSIDFFLLRKQRERENITVLREVVRRCSPDAVLVWGMWNLQRSIPGLAEELLPGRVAYYMGDYWPLLPSQYETYWRVPARNTVTSLPKKLLKPLALMDLAREEQPKLKYINVIFASAFLRDEFSRNGLVWENSKIIYGAADTRLYTCGEHLKRPRDKTLSLLYIGRLVADKGVHTCIQAISKLVDSEKMQGVNLKIVGSGDADYISFLRRFVYEEDLENHVIFLGSLPKADLPAIYHQADIFLFPSIWAEPFGRVLIEAMASGIVVIGTTVGGAGEILKDGENGLTFPPADPDYLAAQISRLVKTPELYQQLVKAGRKTALEKFDLSRMVDEIEAYLDVIVNK